MAYLHCCHQEWNREEQPSAHPTMGSSGGCGAWGAPKDALLTAVLPCQHWAEGETIAGRFCSPVGTGDSPLCMESAQFCKRKAMSLYLTPNETCYFISKICNTEGGNGFDNVSPQKMKSPNGKLKRFHFQINKRKFYCCATNKKCFLLLSARIKLSLNSLSVSIIPKSHPSVTESPLPGAPLTDLTPWTATSMPMQPSGTDLPEPPTHPHLCKIPNQFTILHTNSNQTLLCEFLLLPKAPIPGRCSG